MESTKRHEHPAVADAAMHIVSNATSAMIRMANHPLASLSREARRRLAWFDHYRRSGNVSLTCRYFGISRQTFYYWKDRYDPLHLETLETRSSRPKRRRVRTWTTEQVLAVQAMRQRYPAWGKAKLQRLLAREGIMLSVSMVGRILSYLRRRGQLPTPMRRISARKRPRLRPYAVRKPKGYTVEAPGDLVQLDTLDVDPVPWKHLKQFTAHDVISRYGVLDLHERATANTATQALDAMIDRMPFPIKAIQIDGGSEFMAEFEESCRDRGIQLFVLPPRSPKLNGVVERANRTHTEEFYEWASAPPSVAGLLPALRAWEQLYNCVRPHQALGYKTPAEFLADHSQTHRREEASRR